MSEQQTQIEKTQIEKTQFEKTQFQNMREELERMHRKLLCSDYSLFCARSQVTCLIAELKEVQQENAILKLKYENEKLENDVEQAIKAQIDLPNTFPSIEEMLRFLGELPEKQQKSFLNSLSL